MTILTIIVTCLAAWLVYRDAGKREISSNARLLWAIAAFICPLIGVLAYLIFGRRKPKKEQPREITDGTIDITDEVKESTMNCPNCDSIVAKTNKYCPNCGKELRSDNVL